METKREKNLKTIIDELARNGLSTIGEIIQAINNPLYSAAEVARIYERDQTSSARMLKEANSVLIYYSGKKVSDVKTAIIRLGFQRAKEILLTAAVCDLFKSDQKTGDYSRAGLWKNSIAVATSNRLIYESEYGQQGGEAYMAGLIRNIGIVMEDQCLHEKGFAKAVAQRYQNKTDLAEEERKYLGITHEEIGERIMRIWNLPEPLQEVIGNHHGGKNVVNLQNKKLLYTTKLSEIVCREFEYGYSDRAGDYEKETPQLQKVLGINDPSLSSLKSLFKSEMDQRITKANWFW